MTDILGMHCW